MIDSLGHLKPSAPMKTLWQYNNITYAAASHLPKHLLGQDFDDFVKDKIWKPLGMDNTFYDIEAARATGHLVSGFARRITSDRTGIEDADVCRQDIEMRGGKLSDEGRGIEQEIGWFQEHWQGTAGAVGVISCARDMVSRGLVAP
jgi:CubicO group peptidase (beta-lactamase class C family)